MSWAVPKYDVDAFRRYAADVFSQGEPVVVTEKIHGANARYVFQDGQIFCGSRTERKKNMWWQALEATPTLRSFCEANPGVVVFGEVYGAVTDLPYGHKAGQVSFAAFDLLKDGQWVDAWPARNRLVEYKVPCVPLFNEIKDYKMGLFAPEWVAHEIPYDFDTLCEMAEGKSTLPGVDHVREGVVIKPVIERWHEKIGRVQLKIVGAGYLERK